jgi:hypothetical protein
MEEIAAKPIDLPATQTNKPGWQQGQADRRQYDTLDDYNGYTDFSGTIQAADGSTVNLSNGGSYQRSVAVQSGAVPAGLTGPPEDFVMVTVTVKMPHNQSSSVLAAHHARRAALIRIDAPWQRSPAACTRSSAAAMAASLPLRVHADGTDHGMIITGLVMAAIAALAVGGGDGLGAERQVADQLDPSACRRTHASSGSSRASSSSAPIRSGSINGHSDTPGRGHDLEERRQRRQQSAILGAGAARARRRGRDGGQGYLSFLRGRIPVVLDAATAHRRRQHPAGRHAGRCLQRLEHRHVPHDGVRPQARWWRATLWAWSSPVPTAPTSSRPSLDYVLKFDKDDDVHVEYGTTSLRTPTTLPASQRSIAMGTSPAAQLRAFAHRDRHDRGARIALLMVVAVIAIASVLGYVMLSTASLQNHAGANQVKVLSADYLAESGLNIAMYYLQYPDRAPARNADGYWSGMNGEYTLPMAARRR